MIWQFTIIRDGIETVIDNPPGWDSMSKSIVRDAVTHGVMFNFSESNIAFIDDAYWIIKEEYLLKGIDGDVWLRVEWLCDTCEGYRQLYFGKLNFQTFNEECGDDCSVTVGLDASDAEILIKNRMDTAVDLTNNKAYDGATLLTDYKGLGMEISLPSKAILLKAEATSTPIDGDTGYQIIGDSDYEHYNVNVQDKFIIPKYNNVVLSELDGFAPSPQIDLVSDYTDTPIFTVTPVGANDPEASSYTLDFRMKGKVHIKWAAVGANQTASVTVQISKAFLYGRSRRNLFTDNVTLTYSSSNGLRDSIVREADLSFDWSYTGDINLETGEKMWPVIPIHLAWLSSDNSSFRAAPFRELRVDWDDVSFFKVSNKSTTKPSPANVYLIHEAASRVFEHITNGQYKFKSNYYGRTDSLPYSYQVNGCGGMRALTNGLQIRRAVLRDGTKPKVFLSPKDLYDSCNAIDCVGMGIEDDCVVFEPLKYFYSDEIIFVADGVNKITTTVRVDRTWNQFSFGYQKFETESTNGLDAIHTKRQYRTELKNTDGKLEKLSKIITDGYVAEATRRKFGTSDDWRYDQDIFMFCLRNERSTAYAITAAGQFFFTSFYTKVDLTQIHSGDKVQVTGSGLNSGTFTVDFVSDFGGSGDFAVYFVEPIQQEAGLTVTITLLDAGFTVDIGNIESPENLFDPATVINYAITPIRNAMRWFNWLVQGIPGFANTKVLFNSGEGNYVAKGKLLGGCINEAGPIAENDPLSLADFSDPGFATPFVVPEKDNFRFPMGSNEFVDVATKKYGKIQYRRYPGDEWKYGWIDQLKFDPNLGEAEFSLVTCK